MCIETIWWRDCTTEREMCTEKAAALEKKYPLGFSNYDWMPQTNSDYY